jgi:hypothetical protein
MYEAKGYRSANPHDVSRNRVDSVNPESEGEWHVKHVLDWHFLFVVNPLTPNDL